MSAPCLVCAAHPGWAHSDESKRREPADVCKSCLGSGVDQSKSWQIVTDDDGDHHTRCPRCAALGSIVEQDRTIRWNTLDLSAYPERVVADTGSNGDYDFDQWYCTKCGASDLSQPEGFEIDTWR